MAARISNQLRMRRLFRILSRGHSEVVATFWEVVVVVDIVAADISILPVVG